MITLDEKEESLKQLTFNEQLKMLYMWVKQDVVTLKEFTKMSEFIAEEYNFERLRQLEKDNFFDDEV